MRRFLTLAAATVASNCWLSAAWTLVSPSKADGAALGYAKPSQASAKMIEEADKCLCNLLTTRSIRCTSVSYAS